MHPTRRSLLFAPTAALFAFGDDTLQRLQHLDPTQGGPDDEPFWQQVRSHFDADPTITSFNHAGLSPSPRAVRTMLVRELARMDVEPSRVLFRLQEHELDPVRTRLAKLLGCGDEQLALTPNATWGLHTTILGLPMREGTRSSSRRTNTRARSPPSSSGGGATASASSRCRSPCRRTRPNGSPPTCWQRSPSARASSC